MIRKMGTLQGIFSIRKLVGVFDAVILWLCILFTFSGEFRFALVSYVGFFFFKTSVATMLGQWANKDDDAGSVGTRLGVTAVGFILLVAADWLIRSGGLYSITFFGLTLSLPLMASIGGVGAWFIGMHKNSFQP